MPSRKARIWMGLALVQLTLVTVGARNFDVMQVPVIGRALDYWGALSGSGYGYGFFAPGVFGQLRAIFRIVDANGRERVVPLHTTISHEADVRFGNIIDQFSSGVDNPETFRRSLAASLARSMFVRYEQARQVEVRLEQFKSISMSDYRRGVRPQWKTSYEAKFVYDPKVALE